jgi:hypothetical protein
LSIDRTKLKVPPLPNGGKGGFLAKMGSQNNGINALELEHLTAKHALEMAQLKEKQTARKAKPALPTARVKKAAPYNPIKK